MEAVVSKNRIISLAITWAFVLSSHSAGAQRRAASGLYQIISGTYSECCGIGGVFRFSPPKERQGLVRPKAGPPRDPVAMCNLAGDTPNDVHPVSSTAR